MIETSTTTDGALNDFRESVQKSIDTMDLILNERPGKGGREIALVKTNLQQARMWANKALEERGFYETTREKTD